jgi:hypothetical protein
VQKLLARYREIEADVVREKGEFSLFALFLPEDAYGKWDLIVAAPWIGDWNMKSLEYISGKVTTLLNLEELLALSKIVIVPFDAEDVRDLIEAYPVGPNQKPVELRDWIFSGVPIARAYILTARPTTEVIATPDSVAAG